MELQEMKTLWGEMSVELDKQKKLTDSLIIRMTKADYRNKISKILVPEAISTLIAFAGVIFLLINIQKLNTWYLLASGIISGLILFALPILSLKAIYKMKSLNITDNNFKQSLEEYSKGKIQFMFVQKLSFYLGSVLILTMLPVMLKLMNGRDFFTQTRLWFWYAIIFPFFYVFARWVFKYYSRSAADAENILKELKD